jgi:hypothetical protein
MTGSCYRPVLLLLHLREPLSIIMIWMYQCTVFTMHDASLTPI